MLPIRVLQSNGRISSVCTKQQQHLQQQRHNRSSSLSKIFCLFSKRFLKSEKLQAYYFLPIRTCSEDLLNFLGHQKLYKNKAK